MARIVAAGATDIINFLQQFQGMARGISLLNRDGANAATYILNNDRASAINVPANSLISINDQWIEQIEITAGAAGAVQVTAEIVPQDGLFR